MGYCEEDKGGYKSAETGSMKYFLFSQGDRDIWKITLNHLRGDLRIYTK